MSVLRDMIQLKLERRLLEERLLSTNSKIGHLKEVLVKKQKVAQGLFDVTSSSPARPSTTTAIKSLRLNSSGNHINDNINRPIPADELMVTYGGLRVADFRMPKRTSKTVAMRVLTSNDAEPTPVENNNLIRIRHKQAQRSWGQREIDNRIRLKEERELKAAEKAAKKIRTYPKITIPESTLPNRYIRGELPCTIEHGINGHYLSWACPLEHLDYEYYLPIFFDGLQCSTHPCNFLSRQGIEDMLLASKGHPERVLPCIPSLVRPMRNALNKFDAYNLLGVLKALQQLVTSNEAIGEALMPFCKQFLAPMAAFLDNNRNIGDAIDYGQRKSDDVGEEVRKTLELMEEKGGKKALESIKSSIPLYQSCIRRPDSHHQRNHDTMAMGSSHGRSSAHLTPSSSSRNPLSRPKTSPN